MTVALNLNDEAVTQLYDVLGMAREDTDQLDQYGDDTPDDQESVNNRRAAINTITRLLNEAHKKAEQ